MKALTVGELIERLFLFDRSLYVTVAVDEGADSPDDCGGLCVYAQNVHQQNSDKQVCISGSVGFDGPPPKE